MCGAAGRARWVLYAWHVCVGGVADAVDCTRGPFVVDALLGMVRDAIAAPASTLGGVEYVATGGAGAASRSAASTLPSDATAGRDDDAANSEKVPPTLPATSAAEAEQPAEGARAATGAGTGARAGVSSREVREYVLRDYSKMLEDVQRWQRTLTVSGAGKGKGGGEAPSRSKGAKAAGVGRGAGSDSRSRSSSDSASATVSDVDGPGASASDSDSASATVSGSGLEAVVSEGDAVPEDTEAPASPLPA
jgi:hypothetical protein